MRITLIYLPATAYILLTLFFTKKVGVREISEALVKGHIVIFTFIAVSTEILSLIHGISFPAILTAWLFFLLVCFIAMSVHWKKHDFSLPVLQRLSFLKVTLFATIAFILVATFAAAILYPPNTWDSMTYHMARVANWINNKSVSFYPTAITRQNYQMPLAEFAILNLQVLAGCDLYANLIQWINFLVLICLGLVVSAELGLSNRAQQVSAILICTLPMAILQASSTQNDLVVSCFLMSFGFFMLRLRDNLSAESLFFAATSLGLALLTKGTAFLFCAAIGTSLAVPILMKRKHDFTRLLKAISTLSIVVIIALLLNSGHFLRNIHLYGHPLSTEGEFYLNEDMSTVTLLCNILRNGALHLGTPFVMLNNYQLHALQTLLGSQINNPKTTWLGQKIQIQYSRHEDLAGNLLHLLIAIFVFVTLPIAWAKGYYHRTIWYAIGVMLGTGLYCWILKWQPWASRLHTPLFALAAPLLAIGITSEKGSLRKYFGYVIILSMVLYSVPFALDNKTRSLISAEWKNDDRMQLYFTNRPDLFNDYNTAMKFLEEKNNEKVGLYLGSDDWEYPFWEFARRYENYGRSMTFRHIGVNNVSMTIGEDVQLPIYVIATKPIETWEHASKYVPFYISDNVRIFKISE